MTTISGLLREYGAQEFRQYYINTCRMKWGEGCFDYPWWPCNKSWAAQCTWEESSAIVRRFDKMCEEDLDRELTQDQEKRARELVASRTADVSTSRGRARAIFVAWDLGEKLLPVDQKRCAEAVKGIGSKLELRGSIKAGSSASDGGEAAFLSGPFNYNAFVAPLSDPPNVVKPIDIRGRNFVRTPSDLAMLGAVAAVSIGIGVAAGTMFAIFGGGTAAAVSAPSAQAALAVGNAGSAGTVATGAGTMSVVAEECVRWAAAFILGMRVVTKSRRSIAPLGR